MSLSPSKRRVGRAVATTMLLMGLVVGWLAPVPRASVRADNGITAMHVNSYADSIGALHLVGEVRNDTGQAVEFVDIIATFTDSSGNFLATQDSYSTIDILNPGDMSPFDIILTSPPTGIGRYSLQMQWEPAESTPITGLTILNSAASKDSIGFAHIMGQIRNDSGQTVKFVQIVATFYQADGTVVSVGDTFTKLDTLAPGQTSPFDLLGDTRAYSNYRLQVQAEAP